MLYVFTSKWGSYLPTDSVGARLVRETDTGVWEFWNSTTSAWGTSADVPLAPMHPNVEPNGDVCWRALLRAPETAQATLVDFVHSRFGVHSDIFEPQEIQPARPVTVIVHVPQ